MSMRRIVALVPLALVACTEPPAAPPPPPQKLVDPHPPPPGPPPRETVTLRWKVPPQAPLVLELDAKTDPGKRSALIDLSFIGGKKRTVENPLELDSLLVVDPRPDTDELRIAQIPIVLQPGAMPGGATLSAPGVDAAKLGQVQLRTTMTRSGLVSPNLPVSQREMLATTLELPVQPVGVGDTWASSLLPIWIDGTGWVESKRTHENHATLTAIEHVADGHAVAVIDFVNEEHRDGAFTVAVDSGKPKPKSTKPPEGKPQPPPMKTQPSTFFTGFRGHGRFDVDAGRWLELSVHQIVQSTGITVGTVERDLQLRALPELPAAYREALDGGN